MTIENPAFCLALTGIHFRGELQHVGHLGEQKIKCQPIATRKIAGVRLLDEIYAGQPLLKKMMQNIWNPKFHVVMKLQNKKFIRAFKH